MNGPWNERNVALRAIGALCLTFVVLVSLRIHGFSISQWHAIVDGSPPTEVLIGQPRYMRADDWLVQLPLAFAQRAHESPFPVVNTNIGSGQNMLLPVVAPVAHPILLFRPTQWGFLLGNDLGMAWLWWSQVLGLAGSFFLVALTVSRGSWALSAVGSAFLVVAPFFQFWAFTKSAIPIYLGLAFIASTRLLASRSSLGIALHALLLGWSVIAFAIVLYPPFQVPLLYLYFVLLGGWIWERRGDPPWRDRLGLRATAIGATTVLVASVLVAFYIDAREPIELMLGTVYPGARVSTGGETAPWRWMTAHFGSGAVASDFRRLGNIVEASSFFLCFPVIGLAMAWQRRRDPLAIGLLLYCVLAVAYQTLGIPVWLAKGSLLSFVPGERLLLGLGIADALLLLRYLALDREKGQVPRGASASVAGLWGAALFMGGRVLQSKLPEMSDTVLVVGVLVNVAVAYALCRRARPVLLVCSLVLLVGASTLHFNPLVIGGARFLAENPLSRAVLEIDAAHAGKTNWVVYESSDLPNLLRTIGVKSLGGAITLPQIELWKTLDPDSRSTAVYNRYAHVGFRPHPKPGAPARFHLSSHHGFIVYLDPESDELDRLGVTHLIVRLRSRTRAYWQQFEPLHMEGAEGAEGVEEVAGSHLLFELPLRRRGAVGPNPAR